MALPSVGAIQAALRLAIEGAYREKEKATHRLDECDALEHELAERRDTPPYLPHPHPHPPIPPLPPPTLPYPPLGSTR